MSAEASQQGAAQGSRKKPRQATGVVTSDKMIKTRSVTVFRLVQHPLYRKFIRRRTTYKVHDEANSSRAGDKVLIAQTRPLSKSKRWRLVQVLQRAHPTDEFGKDGIPEEIDSVPEGDAQ